MNDSAAFRALLAAMPIQLDPARFEFAAWTEDWLRRQGATTVDAHSRRVVREAMQKARACKAMSEMTEIEFATLVENEA